MKKFPTKLALAGVVALLTACNHDSSTELRCDTPTAVNPTTFQDFNIRVGSTTTVNAEYNTKLKLTFVGVENESRCPTGVECPAAGSAVLQMIGQVTGQEPRNFTFETDADTREDFPYNDGFYGNYTVNLVKLEPYPRADRTIAAEAYCATLNVSLVVE